MKRSVTPSSAERIRIRGIDFPEYEQGTLGSSEATLHYRHLFLMAFLKHAQGALSELRDNLLPQYLAIRVAIPAEHMGREGLQRAARLKKSRSNGAFQSKLAAWAGEVGIYNDWIMPVLLETLDRWSAGPPAAPGFFIAAFSTLPTPKDAVYRNIDVAERSLSFQCIGPCFGESLQAFRDRAMAGFSRKLDQHLSKLESALKASGAKRTTKKADASHFEWLVRFQVCRESKTQIAKTEGRSQVAVSEGIASAATLANINLRVVKAGRPKTRRVAPTTEDR